MAETFFRTVQIKSLNTCLQHKNMYNDRLDDIVNIYNNTYHGTNKMKLVYVK